jgi:excisionase family DNA binding protein
MFMNDLVIHMTRQDLRNELNLFAETIRDNTPEITTTKEPEYLTRKETAKKLHISLVTLNRLTNEGILQSYKIGGRVLYKTGDVNQSISENLKKYRR